MKISARLSADGTDFTMMVSGESFERNQWYLTARDLDRGVIRGGSVVARISAAMRNQSIVSSNVGEVRPRYSYETRAHQGLGERQT